MLSDDLRELLKPVLLVHKVIWGAITLSIFVYVVAVFIVLRGPYGKPPGAPAGLTPVFYALGLVAAVFSIAYRRRTLSDERLQARLTREHDFGLRASADVSSPRLAGRLRAIENLSTTDRRLLFLAGSITVPIIVSLAANEAVVTFGLVLSLTSGDTRAILPFAVAALFLNLLMLPRTGEILERAQGWASLV